MTKERTNERVFEKRAANPKETAVVRPRLVPCVKEGGIQINEREAILRTRANEASEANLKRTKAKRSNRIKPSAQTASEEAASNNQSHIVPSVKRTPYV